jgi:hypothetical protein
VPTTAIGSYDSSSKTGGPALVLPPDPSQQEEKNVDIECDSCFSITSPGSRLRSTARPQTRFQISTTQVRRLQQATPTPTSSKFINLTKLAPDPQVNNNEEQGHLSSLSINAQTFAEPRIACCSIRSMIKLTASHYTIHSIETNLVRTYFCINRRSACPFEWAWTPFPSLQASEDS